MKDESDISATPSPHKILPYHVYYITQVYCALCGTNLILKKRILFLASTHCSLTLLWKTRDRVDKTMETLWVPVKISTTSLLQKIPTDRPTDRQGTKFPSSEPHTWGYSTAWYCVPHITWTAETSCCLCVREIPCAAVFIWLFRGFLSVSWGVA
jgi:hypothetical protein